LPRENRRLAAIVAADIAGYSRLIGLDEEGTLRALRAHRAELIDPLIEEHGGRIANTAGDSILLEFPSAVDAVRCAIAVQAGIAARNSDIETGRQICFRIGINVGDVVAEGDDLLGDGVNVAARLETLASPGGICLSEDVWRQARGKVEADVVDLGNQKLKNIADPVHVYRIGNGAGSSTDRPLSTAVDVDMDSLRSPSILLFPFRHLGPGDTAEALASGLTETLAAALTQFEEFDLIDPGSARQANASSDTREVGRSVGARYLLEGSVQIALEKARIGVQLVAVETGQRIWSETLDRNLDDVFALQDDITAFVASTMGDAVSEEQAEAIADVPDSELNLGQRMARGTQLLHRSGRRNNTAARRIFEQVREVAPDALFPTLCLCWTYASEQIAGWPPEREDGLEYSLALMADLLRRQSRSAHAHRCISRLLFLDGDPARGLAHAERAYELNPYHSDMMIELGLALLWSGRTEEALVHLERAFGINPYVPASFKPYLALAYFLTDRHEDGLRALGSLDGGSSLLGVYQVLNLVGLGRVAEAREQMRLLLDANPRIEGASARIAQSFILERDRERVVSALREAGLKV
jgi:adenylate cyclase